MERYYRLNLYSAYKPWRYGSVYLMREEHGHLFKDMANIDMDTVFSVNDLLAQLPCFEEAAKELLEESDREYELFTEKLVEKYILDEDKVSFPYVLLGDLTFWTG